MVGGLRDVLCTEFVYVALVVQNNLLKNVVL